MIPTSCTTSQVAWYQSRRRSHHENRSDETKERKARRERADTDTHLVPSEAQDSNDLESEPNCGEEHAQMVTPFEELDGG